MGPPPLKGGCPSQDSGSLSGAPWFTLGNHTIQKVVPSTRKIVHLRMQVYRVPAAETVALARGRASGESASSGSVPKYCVAPLLARWPQHFEWSLEGSDSCYRRTGNYR